MIEICIFFIVLFTIKATAPKPFYAICRKCGRIWNPPYAQTLDHCDKCFQEGNLASDQFVARDRCLDALTDGTVDNDEDFW